MKNYLVLFIAFTIVLSSCIKDDIIEDFVEPTVRITSIPDTIQLNSTYQFEFAYFNNVGLEEEVEGQWLSSDPSIIQIDDSGLATALALGEADITIEYQNNGDVLSESITVNVGGTTVEQSEGKSGVIQTTSSYVMEGSFTLTEEGDDLILNIEDDYKASTALPGLYLFLTNNRNSVTDALMVSKVETYNGAHSYTIENVGINDYQFLLYYCDPFQVKVGDGEIK